MKLIRIILLAMVSFQLIGCSSVQTHKVDESHFELLAFYNEPPRDLSSKAIASQADEVCPQGYDVLSKTAEKAGELGVDDNQCAVSKACDYALQWRIVCVERPKEPFSIFGNI